MMTVRSGLARRTRGDSVSLPLVATGTIRSTVSRFRHYGWGCSPTHPYRCLVFCDPSGGTRQGALGIAGCSGWGDVPRDVVYHDHSPGLLAGPAPPLTVHGPCVLDLTGWHCNGTDSAFTVHSAKWAAGTNADPHVIEIQAAPDNKVAREDLDLAPWS
jgi:hypothetical protein